jgi:hypothetical protein
MDMLWWSQLGTLVGGVATVLLFFAAIGAAWIYYRQLRALSNQLDSTLIFNIFQWYSSPEMRSALHAVWNDPPEMFNKDNPEKEDQRRRVSHFWYMIAVLWERELVDEDLIFTIFPDAMAIWGKRLRTLEQAVVLRVLNRDEPTMANGEKQRLAEKHVNEIYPTTRLYNRWLSRQATLPRNSLVPSVERNNPRGISRDLDP